MSSTPEDDVDPTLAYPEPPASLLWQRQGPKPRPITPEQQRRNRELLVLAQRTVKTPRSFGLRYPPDRP